MQDSLSRAEALKRAYHLEAHVEGGSFSEVYTSPWKAEGRPLAGSIFFLLDRGEVSRFHEIDCDEIWFFHEGCGMRLTILSGGEKTECLLGMDAENGARAMVVIPAGSIFAAENLHADGFTFVSCVTAPKFTYEGFRLVSRQELRRRYPADAGELEYLAVPEAETD